MSDTIDGAPPVLPAEARTDCRRGWSCSKATGVNAGAKIASDTSRSS